MKKISKCNMKTNRVAAKALRKENDKKIESKYGFDDWLPLPEDSRDYTLDNIPIYEGIDEDTGKIVKGYLLGDSCIVPLGQKFTLDEGYIDGLQGCSVKKESIKKTKNLNTPQ